MYVAKYDRRDAGLAYNSSMHSEQGASGGVLMRRIGEIVAQRKDARLSFIEWE